MELSPVECGLYAQVTAIFVVAAIAISKIWVGGPRSRHPGRPALMVPFAIIAGAVATFTALIHAGTGARGVAAFIILGGTSLCFWLVIALGVTEPFAAFIIGRGARRREQTEAKKLAKRRRNEPPRPDSPDMSDGGNENDDAGTRDDQ